MHALILIASVALATPISPAAREVLVLNSAGTKMTSDALDGLRKGIFVQNNGPNAIWCSPGTAADAVLTKSVKVAASGGSITMGTTKKVYCRAASADQTTGAATTVVEIF